LATRFRFRSKDGLVIVEVRAGSQAAQIGLVPGDLVKGVNDLTITTRKDFTEAVIRYRLKERITVRIQRGWTVYSVPFKMWAF